MKLANQVQQAKKNINSHGNTDGPSAIMKKDIDEDEDDMFGDLDEDD